MMVVSLPTHIFVQSTCKSACYHWDVQSTI